MADSRNLGRAFTIGLFGLCAFPVIYAICDSFKIIPRDELNRQAEAIAVTRYGDKKIPFTLYEKKEWYRDMGIPEIRRPNADELRNYIESHTNKNK